MSAKSPSLRNRSPISNVVKLRVGVEEPVRRHLKVSPACTPKFLDDLRSHSQHTTHFHNHAEAHATHV